MKKILLLSIAIVFNFTMSNAQITITNLAGTSIHDGDVITFNTTGDDANLVTLITNTSISSVDLKLVAETITGTDGSDMEFCFGTCRWGITQGEIYGPVTIDGGATTGSAEVHFHNHSTENDVITYAFKIYEEGNETNAVHFTYKYDVNFTATEKISESNIAVYPNPASNFVNIKAEKFDEVIFTNISGQVVKRASGQKQISTSELVNGIYFYSIISENKIIKNGRLIINKY